MLWIIYFNLEFIMSTTEDYINQEIARALTIARKSKLLNQAEVAQHLAMPQSFVSRYENAKQALEVAQLLRLCELLEVDASKLIHTVIEIAEFRAEEESKPRFGFSPFNMRRS